MKNGNDTTWNRTRDLPACSAVPQPNVPPRAPCFYVLMSIVTVFFGLCEIIFSVELKALHFSIIYGHLREKCLKMAT